MKRSAHIERTGYGIREITQKRRSVPILETINYVRRFDGTINYVRRFDGTINYVRRFSGDTGRL